jgi:hypothetical protein
MRAGACYRPVAVARTRELSRDNYNGPAEAPAIHPSKLSSDRNRAFSPPSSSRRRLEGR